MNGRLTIDKLYAVVQVLYKGRNPASADTEAILYVSTREYILVCMYSYSAIQCGHEIDRPTAKPLHRGKVTVEQAGLKLVDEFVII